MHDAVKPSEEPLGTFLVLTVVWNLVKYHMTDEWLLCAYMHVSCCIPIFRMMSWIM